jgi:nucleoside-diphosphate-sugar epimerase
VPPVRFFITGASGFIGRTLADRLRADGHEVRGCDLVADPGRGVVAGDVAAPGSWGDAMAGCDVVVHTAAHVSLRLGGRDEIWRTNVLGTRNVLDAAVAAGVPRMVHFSSITVFGNDFPDAVDEHHPVRPTGVPYPDSKIASEQVVLQAHAEGRIAVTVVRPGDVYGPRSGAWAVLPAEGIRARRFALPDRGRGLHGAVYVDNLVDAVVLAATTPAAAGEVITVVDGLRITTREFFAPYGELLGRRVIALPSWLALPFATLGNLVDRGGDVNPQSARYMSRRSTYSNAKARRLLGWEPRVGVEEGLAATMAWLTEQGYGRP